MESQLRHPGCYGKVTPCSTSSCRHRLRHNVLAVLVLVLVMIQQPQPQPQVAV
jgi:hypothetical protein